MNIFQKQFLHPRYWPSWLGLLLMRLSVYLPAKLQYRLGLLLGQMMQPFMRSRAKVVRRNLELCFPEMSQEERETLVKSILNNTGMMLIEKVYGKANH